jgi:DNA repair exonuclease SbcCD ATPase subunit
MKIISLQAENVKNLRAVEIIPVGNVIEITGKNGAGKTSVLDSIWMALCGATALKETPEPIRHGEKKARIRLDMGDLIVTRKFTPSGDTLQVENSEGLIYKTPQSMLDRLVGKLSFDPLAFSHMKDREQRETLLGLVKLDIDLEEWAQKRQERYDIRTGINREVKALEAQIAALTPVPSDTPDEEISVAAILQEQRCAQEVITKNNEKRALVVEAAAETDRLERDVVGASERVSELRTTLGNMEKRLAELKSLKTAASKVEVHLRDESKDLLDPDLTLFEDKVAKVEWINNCVRVKKARTTLKAELTAQEASVTRSTEGIKALDAEKVAAMNAAKFPIDGLAIDDDGVTYRDIPFSQCSAAERLRVSLAMAMAMNPHIRVLRITDGSLLDSANLKVIREMVTTQDFQLWIESVNEDGKVGVYIQNGEVTAVDGQPVK